MKVRYPVNKLLLICDVNRFIDFKAGNILQYLFALPYTPCVLDLLFEEELSKHHSDLLAEGLLLIPLSSSSIGTVQNLTRKYPKTSYHDPLALVLALQESSVLVTGDKELRQAAMSESVTVWGTVGIIGTMYRHALLPLDQAKTAFDNMKVNGRWLVWTFIDKWPASPADDIPESSVRL